MKRRNQTVWSFTDMKTGHTMGLVARSQKDAATQLKQRGYKFKDLKKHK